MACAARQIQQDVDTRHRSRDADTRHRSRDADSRGIRGDKRSSATDRAEFARAYTVRVRSRRIGYAVRRFGP